MAAAPRRYYPSYSREEAFSNKRLLLREKTCDPFSQGGKTLCEKGGADNRPFSLKVGRHTTILERVARGGI